MNTPILDTVIQAMELAVEYEKPINMNYFYRKRDAIKPETDVHTCGTPACVAGYAALMYPVNSHLRDPSELWDSLDRELNERFDNSLASSIFEEAPEVRWRLAKKSKLPAELLKLNHLNKDEPTASDALEYVRALREHLNKDAT